VPAQIMLDSHVSFTRWDHRPPMLPRAQPSSRRLGLPASKESRPSVCCILRIRRSWVGFLKRLRLKTKLVYSGRPMKAPNRPAPISLSSSPRLGTQRSALLPLGHACLTWNESSRHGVD
jgi:hypothetical protein